MATLLAISISQNLLHGLMRKIITAVSLIILGIMLNFTLWFLHTRTIIDTVSALKRQLLLVGIEFKYTDIRFTNFLAWKAKVVIDNPSFKTSSNYVRSFDKIDMQSNPLSNFVTISFPTTMGVFHSTSESSDGGKQHIKPKQLVKFDDTPLINLTTSTSLSKLRDAFRTGERLNSHIKNLSAHVKGVRALDATNGEQLQYQFDNMTLQSVSTNDTKTNTLNLQCNISGFRYNPQYIAIDKGSQTLHETLANLGEINVNADISFDEFFDAHKTHYTTLDHYKVSINNVRAIAKPFSILITGYFGKNRSDPFPLFDIVMKIEGYEALLQYYASVINFTLDGATAHNGAMAIKKISKEQVHALTAMLKNLSTDNTEDNNISLQFFRDSQKTTIAGKPLSLIVKQLQALFLLNLPATME